YGPKFEDVQAQLVAAEENLGMLQEGREFDAERRQLDEQANTDRLALGTAASTLRGYEDFHVLLRSRGLLLFGVILVVAGAGSLGSAATWSLPRALPFYGSAVAAVAACGLVVLGTFFFDVQMPDSGEYALAPRPAQDRHEDAAAALAGGFWQNPQPAAEPMPAMKADRPAEGRELGDRKAEAEAERRGNAYRGA